MLIKFQAPTVAPTGVEEEETFSQLEALISSGKIQYELAFYILYT